MLLLLLPLPVLWSEEVMLALWLISLIKLKLIYPEFTSKQDCQRVNATSEFAFIIHDRN
jgi:hypothetical protein